MFDPQVLSHPGTILLDSARPDDENRASWCFTAPDRILTASTHAEIPGLIEALKGATTQGQYVAGYFSYEAGYPFVDLEPPTGHDAPLAWFGIYDAPHRLASADVETGLKTLEAYHTVQNVRLGVSRSDYAEAISAIKGHIREGEVYQINYTAPLRFQFSGDPRGLYCRLRHRQRVPYGAFLNLGERQILSCSPELFMRREGDRVLTRPMKGTIQRGRTLTEDQALREELTSDPKNRAENLMIVDLLRNDLSVCCQPGTVEVPDLYTTISYETVTQMTSTVGGRLRGEAELADLLRALFPCGSVTGAPKRRAMQLIRGLEPHPRGVYCGAIGMAGPDETAVFNVAIRTAVLDGEEGAMGVGSGIVWDSEPETEYEECRLKGQFLTGKQRSQSRARTEDFRLIEAMRYEEGRLPLLDRHVDRLSKSAAYFSFPFDEDRFRRRVRTAVSRNSPEPLLKVRATLNRWGRLAVTTNSIEVASKRPWELTIAEERADRTDPFFYHKTTRRGVYDQAFETARADGFDEALLLNQDGEVTEGTYSNVFVQQDNELWTPPIDSGLLAGVYRDHVLDTCPVAGERILTLADLKAADALYCCNAVRGWQEAELNI